MSAAPTLKFLADNFTMNAIVATAMLTKNFEIFPSNWVNSGLGKALCTIIYDACVAMEKLIADMNPHSND